jgi:hypothetical protein
MWSTASVMVPPAARNDGNEVEHLSFQAIAPANPESASQDLGELDVHESIRCSRLLLVRVLRCCECTLQGRERYRSTRPRLFGLERFPMARKFHHVSAIVGLVRKVLGCLVVVRRTNEPDVLRQRKGPTVLKKDWCRLHGGGHRSSF